MTAPAAVRPDAVAATLRVAASDRREPIVVRRIRAGTDPEQLARSPDGRRRYAANEDVGTATATDLSTRRVLSTAVVGIEPEGIAASSDGRWVYVTAETSNSVSMMDAATLEVAGNVLVDVRPRAVAFSPDSRFAYVSAEIGGSLYTANGLSDDVSIVDTRTLRTVGTIRVGKRPWGVAIVTPP